MDKNLTKNSDKTTILLSKIIIIYLVTQLVFDFIQKVNRLYIFNIPKFHRYLKLVFIVSIGFYILFNLKKVNKKILIAISALLIVFIISQNFIYQRIEYLLQYLFLLLTLLAVSANEKFVLQKLYIVLKYFFITNFIFVIVGWVFDIDIFRTYNADRFGYNGFVISAMQTTVLYFSIIVLSLKNKDYLMFILAIVASFLAGTKALLLGLPIFLGILWYKKRKQISIYYFFALSSVFILLFVKLLKTPIFNNLIHEKGFFSAFFSFRNDNLRIIISKISNKFDVWNFLFGKYDLNTLRSEFDFVDLFLFFGLFGLILYFYIGVQIIKTSKLNLYSKAYIIVIIIVSFFSGNIIYYPFNGIMILSTFYFLNNFTNYNLKKMNTNKINILNTSIDNLTMNETIKIIHKAIDKNKQIHHVVVNAGKIVAMQDDLELRKSVNESDVINADGQAVVWASKVLKKPLKERVAGVDLMSNLVAKANQKNWKIFFFGAKEDIIKKVVKTYSEKYSEKIIAGYRNGYFKKEDEKQIAQEIADSGANILFVAISSPTKENFLYQNKNLLKNVNFIMGVGGSFDVIAGKVKRAPVWMQNYGLEWFYRFLQEPKRMWKRYLVGNMKFIWLVLKEKFKK